MAFIKKITKQQWGALLASLLVAGLFLGATMLAQTYSAGIEKFVLGAGWKSMALYVVVTILGTVLAPVSTMPLIPLVAQSWGLFLTALLSIIGWVIGSLVAFSLSRRYGVKLISRFVSVEKLRSYESVFSSKHLFWTVVLLRMVVPVDVLSYALGIFSSMTTRSYLLATIIGVIPFAFIFSFTGTLTPGLQFIVLIEILLLLVLIYYIRQRFRQ